MFDYGDPLNPYNDKDSAMEIARLTRLLGEAYVNNARLLEVVVATTSEADEAAAAARQVSNLSEDERVEAQRTITSLKTERDALRLRADVAEEGQRASQNQAVDLKLQLDLERDNHEATRKELDVARIALMARIAELEALNTTEGGAQ